MAMLQRARAAGRLHRNPPAQLSWSRTFADHGHGPAKVPMWADPTSPSKWKEEHFVFVSLAGWGALFYSGYKFFTSGPKKEKQKPAAGGKKECPTPPAKDEKKKGSKH